MTKQTDAILRAVMAPRTRVELQAIKLLLRRGGFRVNDEWLDCHMLIFVEAGALRVWTADTVHLLAPGDLCWLVPGQLKRFSPAPDRPVLKQWNMRFRLEGCAGAAALLPPRDLWRGAWDLLPTLEQLRTLHDQGHPYRAVRLRALLATALTTVLGLPDPHAAQGLNPRQRQRLEAYVADNLHLGIRAGDLAALTGLTVDYFARLFRASYGQAPRDWLVQQRMQRAATLFRQTTMSAKQAALELGIVNPSLFTRQFRQVYGCTPRDFRRRQRD